MTKEEGVVAKLITVGCAERLRGGMADALDRQVRSFGKSMKDPRLGFWDNAAGSWNPLLTDLKQGTMLRLRKPAAAGKLKLGRQVTAKLMSGVQAAAQAAAAEASSRDVSSRISQDVIVTVPDDRSGSAAPVLAVAAMLGLVMLAKK